MAKSYHLSIRRRFNAGYCKRTVFVVSPLFGVVVVVVVVVGVFLPVPVSVPSLLEVFSRYDVRHVFRVTCLNSV